MPIEFINYNMYRVNSRASDLTLIARSSHSHPLEIAAVEVAPNRGHVGITFCPGKKQADALSGSWARDLDIDLDVIENWGAAAVVTLIEDHEMASLGVTGIGDAVTTRNMSWYHLPIPDVTAPASGFEKQWQVAGAELRDLLRAGFNIVVHCKGGLGRAGTVAARLLIELGWSSSDAVAEVRLVRPGAIETIEQEKHLRTIVQITPIQSLSPVSLEDKCLGALIGLAVGDAVGTTLEFKSRDTYPKLTDMIGGGPFTLQSGEWTDDTAMALALADSLISRGQLDQTDLMQRFLAWWRRGEYSCTGSCFDIGIATSRALARFEDDGDPLAGSTDPNSAGNGALMRLAPIVLHWFGIDSEDTHALAELARAQGAVTHGAAASLEACAAFAELTRVAVTAPDKGSVLEHSYSLKFHPEVDDILAGSWRGKHRRDVRSSGYVLHSLEAAIWCFARTSNFRDAVLLAANLGDDADTTAAITGQLAGAFYGLEAIPAEWRQKLAWGDKIEAVGYTLLRKQEGNLP